ncbi:MAG: alpha/beta fold hydrolase [Spirochaetota bacterium]
MLAAAAASDENSHSHEKERNEASPFVLTHGARHGPWCWNGVVPLPEQRGHTVRTVDLPGHGEDSTPVSEVTLSA